MFPAAWYLNREIGDGEHGYLKHRWQAFLIWANLNAILSYCLFGWSYEALACTLFGSVGYWIFRQIMSPNPAFYASHGSISPNHKPGMNFIIKCFAELLFGYDQYSVYHSREQSIDFGIKVGGLVGFCKSFLGWGIIGTAFISTYALFLPALGFLYGLIHYKNRNKGERMREMSEKWTGVVIIAPNTIIPIWFYDGGWLKLLGVM